MKIAFLGTPKIAADVLENLAKSPYKPSLVITGQNTKSGRGLASKPTAVELVAKKHKIPTSYKLTDIDKSFDVAVLLAYGKMIPDDILAQPKFGFINIHPSLLPKYRGASPISSAILASEKETGVTLIILDSDLDHGPIIAQKSVTIQNDDTQASLSTKLADLGSKLLVETLPEYLEENITPKTQLHEMATYTEKVEKRQGKIDLEKPPSPEALDKMIRAYFPWPGVWIEMDGKKFKLLPENKIQPEGKRPMSMKEFKNGYPQIGKDLIGLFSPLQ